MTKLLPLLYLTEEELQKKIAEFTEKERPARTKFFEDITDGLMKRVKRSNADYWRLIEEEDSSSRVLIIGVKGYLQKVFFLTYRANPDRMMEIETPSGSEITADTGETVLSWIDKHLHHIENGTYAKYINEGWGL